MDIQRFNGVVEVIVIDDESTDETEQVLLDLQSILTDMQVVRQCNSGLGAARNRGLELARGEYIWFVDGDDFLHERATEKVLETLSLHAPDILVVDFTCSDEEGQPIDWIRCSFSIDHGRMMEGGDFFCRHHAVTYAFLYLFRRDIFLKFGFKFQPRINMQDAELLPRVMEVASKVFVSGIEACTYVKRAGSFINNPDPGVRERYFRSVVEVRRRLIDFLKGLDDSPIREGVIAKLDAINTILLMAYIYDHSDVSLLSGRLALLRGEGVYPFTISSDAGFKNRILRLAVNLQPTLFPRVYRWIRTAAIFQHVVALAQRNRKPV